MPRGSASRRARDRRHNGKVLLCASSFVLPLISHLLLVQSHWLPLFEPTPTMCGSLLAIAAVTVKCSSAHPLPLASALRANADDVRLFGVVLTSTATVWNTGGWGLVGPGGHVVDGGWGHLDNDGWGDIGSGWGNGSRWDDDEPGYTIPPLVFPPLYPSADADATAGPSTAAALETASE
ncbi:hypothetical protein B0H14DRAFT_3504465 [Mycena olivaceomarginata]|nr:hypothetical protein B0H14DRAFT_3504465 [Mycena olivaceomarginata]